ncbi:MAG: sigma-54 dependent transcriptional regulator [Deltaproteobacteria bacterium]
MKTGRVLLVDDDPGVGQVLGALLAQGGHESNAVDSGAAALEALEARPYDVVVTDQRMPKMDGLTLLGQIRERWPELPVVMLTAHGTIPLAVEAMRVGAYDFVLKPFDREEILFTIGKAIATSRHRAALPVSRGGSAVDTLDATLAKVAPARTTVLLTGETGTGKSRAARMVHDASPRKDEPFVTVQCGALPEHLLESELFGYDEGAFTGATKTKPGRVEIADGGTLFLDEIGDISPGVQAKLLRLLQERTYERLGGTTSREADIRVIAATHRDLEELVEEGKFRRDLYFRLNVVQVEMPPLRSYDPDTIARLAHRFCAAHAEENGRPDMSVARDALDRLVGHAWPGNIRELENFMERLVVLADGATISLEEVERGLSSAASFAGDDASARLDDRRRAAERDALVQALERAKNNRSRAARILGVSRRTLYNKLHEHELL